MHATTLFKALDLSSAPAKVAPNLLKALAILSDKLSENLQLIEKPNWKTEEKVLLMEVFKKSII